MTTLTASPAWQALQAHAGALRGKTLRQLFADDPARFGRFSLRPMIAVDYSSERHGETM
jgi:glucose-6-phosphate isomerase